MSSILAISGPHVGRRFTLKALTRLGRAPDNEILLADNLVSRYHAHIERSGGTFVVSDLGSKNGIQVNGKAQLDCRLRRGDEIKVGESTFVFEAPQELKTARFTNTLIHLDPEQDDTMRVMESESVPEAETGEAVALILKLAKVFEAASSELPEMLRKILGHLAELFGATSGSILLRGRNGEVVPLTALASKDELHINREAARLVLDEARAVLTSSFYISADDKISRRPRKAMIAPMFEKEQVFGAIHLERAEGSDYSFKDISFLQALSRLVSGAVRQAIRLDQLAQGKQTNTTKILGMSKSIEEIREQIEKLATTDTTVLVTGETGTGKELVARAIHDKSVRMGGPFVAINCAAIPPTLIESELFGYEKGAFTGADSMRRGKIEMADAGTLFLDEIGEMDVMLQPKLLRFLEERIFYRVGGIRPIQTDVRIITATNRNLEDACKQGKFREDLLYRLKVLTITLPPLRKRREDIRLIVETHAQELAARLGKPFLGIDDQAWTLLESYRWPGNVRELLQSLERALILSDNGILSPECFQLSPPSGSEPPESITASRKPHMPGDNHPTPEDGITQPDLSTLPLTLAEVEKRAIIRAIRFAAGNKNKAADLLAIHRNTLRKKIQEYGLEE